MMFRSLAVTTALAAVALCGLSAACGNDDSSAAAGAPSNDAGSSAEAGSGADAAGCAAVYAKDFDRTCTVDSDCVSVPFGGNLCDPCGTGAECFQCSIASVNRGASLAYGAALHAAISAAESRASSLECFGASCPPAAGPDSGFEPRCVSGLCVASEEGVAGCQ